VYLEYKHRAVKYFYRKVVSIVIGLKDTLYNFNNLKQTTRYNTNTLLALTVLNIKIANNYRIIIAIKVS
jgi:hypothetical protein